MDSCVEARHAYADIDYEKLFRAANTAQRVISDAQLESAIQCLVPGHARQYPAFHNLLQAAQADDFSRLYTNLNNNVDLRHAIGAELFLHAAAANFPMKYSQRKSYLHSLETREIFLRCAAECVTVEEQLVAAAIAALHDVLEDFEITEGAVRSNFGTVISNNVDLMTTPDTKTLLLRFPEITELYLPYRDMSGIRDSKIDIDNYLEVLKRTLPETFAHLKSSLKTEFKLGQQERHLIFVGVSTKMADGVAVMNEYVRNIKEGELVLDPGLKAGEKRQLPPYSTAISPLFIMQTLEDRTMYHQAGEKKIETFSTDFTMPQKGNMYVLFNSRLRTEFIHARRELLDCLDLVAPANDNTGLRKRITLARQHEYAHAMAG